MTEILITIPRVPPSGNELRRKYRHWAVYKQLKTSWAWDLKSYCGGPETFYLITGATLKIKMRLHFNIGRKRLLDKDNAYAGVKPIVDAARELKFIYQDSPKYLELIVEQFKSAKSVTEIRISEAV